MEIQIESFTWKRLMFFDQNEYFCIQKGLDWEAQNENELFKQIGLRENIEYALKITKTNSKIRV